jgi:small-conductance mechanosensitive channel
MNELWQYRILNNTVGDWLLMIGIFSVSVIILRLIQSLIIRKLVSLTGRTKTTIDDFLVTVVRASVMPALYILAFYFSLQYLALPEKWRAVERVAIMVVTTFFVLKIINSFISYLVKSSFLQQEENEQRRKQSRGILLIVHVIVWACGLVFLVDNLGYDITTLVAGLGIGGIAIALAAQTILGDLFSYLVIFFDKPFEIGDFIIVEDKMGVVEYIGIKTTRIRTLGGEQLVCSNTDLTNSRVHNYKRMQERRVVFSFGVEYGTSADQLRMIPGKVRQIVSAIPETRFDRAHFKSFGESSLDFEVVYFILTPDYNLYMDVQQRINLEIFAEFERQGINFAFPTRTLFISRTGSDANGHEEKAGPERKERQRDFSRNV